MKGKFVFKGISFSKLTHIHKRKILLFGMAVKITIEERVEILEILVDRPRGRFLHMFRDFLSDIVYNFLYSLLARCLNRFAGTRNQDMLEL